MDAHQIHSSEENAGYFDRLNWNQEHVTTVVLGGLFTYYAYLIIPTILLMGYFVKVLRTTLTRNNIPLFDRWSRLLVDGINSTAISIYYLANPFTILTLVITNTTSPEIFILFQEGDILSIARGLLGSGIEGGAVLLAAFLSLYALPAALVYYVILTSEKEPSQADFFQIFPVKVLRPGNFYDILSSTKYAAAWLAGALMLITGIISMYLPGIIGYLLNEFGAIGMVARQSVGLATSSFYFYAQVHTYSLIGRRLQNTAILESLQEQPNDEIPFSDNPETSLEIFLNQARKAIYSFRDACSQGVIKITGTIFNLSRKIAQYLFWFDVPFRVIILGGGLLATSYTPIGSLFLAAYIITILRNSTRRNRIHNSIAIDSWRKIFHDGVGGAVIWFGYCIPLVITYCLSIAIDDSPLVWIVIFASLICFLAAFAISGALFPLLLYFLLINGLPRINNSMIIPVLDTQLEYILLISILLITFFTVLFLPIAFRDFAIHGHISAANPVKVWQSIRKYRGYIIHWSLGFVITVSSTAIFSGWLIVFSRWIPNKFATPLFTVLTNPFAIGFIPTVKIVHPSAILFLIIHYGICISAFYLLVIGFQKATINENSAGDQSR